MKNQIKMLLLQCPKCRNKMKYRSRDVHLMGKKKQCVYCGFQMTVSKYIVDKI